jgi:hypothetical protein
MRGQEVGVEGERGSSDDVCAEAEEPDGGPKQPTVQAKVEDQLSWEILFYCKGNCRSEGGGSLSQLAGDLKVNTLEALHTQRAYLAGDLKRKG